jgi:hypothetical protein
MSHSENLDRGVGKFPARSRGCGIIHDVKPMDGHVRIVTWPDVRIVVGVDPRRDPGFPGGRKMCKNGDFAKNPQNWPKMPNLPKWPKTPIFGKTPKMTKKRCFFRECESVSTGALTCDESRRIIYCLDTRYGPQNGGFGPPPGGGTVYTEIGVFAKPRKHAFRENRVFRVLQKHRKTEYPERGRPMESTGSRIDQRSE